MSTPRAKRRPFEETTVSADQSKAEIRDLLIRYGAEQFGIAETATQAVIGFFVHGRMVRLEVPLPDRRQSTVTKAGKFLRAHSPAALSVHDQEERRLWRATRAWIFAQLEAVESGIKTFESVFLADTVLANGQTVGQWYGTEVQQMAQAGELPSLPGLKPSREERR